MNKSSNGLTGNLQFALNVTDIARGSLLRILNAAARNKNAGIAGVNLVHESASDMSAPTCRLAATFFTHPGW